MIRKTSLAYKKSRGWFIVGVFALVLYIFLAVPPSSPFVILLFIFLFSLFITTLFSFFLRLRDSLLIGVTAGLLFCLNAYFGLNLINTVLLISLVIGLRFLVQ